MDIKVNIHDYITEVVDLDITDDTDNRLTTTCKKDDIDRVLEESQLVLNDTHKNIIHNSANGCIIADSIVGNFNYTEEQKKEIMKFEMLYDSLLVQEKINKE